jgi:hypothetical protein
MHLELASQAGAFVSAYLVTDTHGSDPTRTHADEHGQDSWVRF